jgi:hypothetical protein
MKLECRAEDYQSPERLIGLMCAPSGLFVAAGLVVNHRGSAAKVAGVARDIEAAIEPPTY